VEEKQKNKGEDCRHGEARGRNQENERKWGMGGEGVRGARGKKKWERYKKKRGSCFL